MVSLYIMELWQFTSYSDSLSRMVHQSYLKNEDHHEDRFTVCSAVLRSSASILRWWVRLISPLLYETETTFSSRFSIRRTDTLGKNSFLCSLSFNFEILGICGILHCVFFFLSNRKKTCEIHFKVHYHIFLCLYFFNYNLLYMFNCFIKN